MSDSFLLMYDAVPEGVALIPEKAEAVAGYVDGNFQSFPLLCRRFFPHAHCVSIGVFEGNLAAFSDVEQGNPINTPERVRIDFQRKRAHAIWRPGYYGDHEHMVNVILPGLAGVPRDEYRLWLAEWNGVRTVPPGYDAKQYTNNSRARGADGPYDTSIVDIQRFFPTRKPIPPVHKPNRKPTNIHPKVAASAVAGTLSTALMHFLNAKGIHVTHLAPTEEAAIAVAASAISGYLKRSGESS